jgi:hypothetical protein
MSNLGESWSTQLIYSSICDGFSKFNNVYIKHPNQREKILYLDRYNFFLNEAKSVGVLSEEEQIKSAIENGCWSKEKENSLNSYNLAIDRLLKTKSSLIFDSDKRRIQEQINDLNEKIISASNERSSFLSMSAESWAQVRLKDYFIINFFFENYDLTKKTFARDDDIEYVDDDDFFTYSSCYYSYLNIFSNKNIKKCSLMLEFQNTFFISDMSAQSFFGKPIIGLTTNQIDLLIYGKYYNNIIKNTEAKIPQELYDDPDKFEEWCESSSQKRKLMESKNKKGGSTFIVGERDDLSSMGLDISGDNIIKESKQKGSLSFSDMLNR